MVKNDEEMSETSVQEEGNSNVFDPSDLRVLAIDANVVSLKYLVVILQKCQYKVTATTMAAEGLKILRENKNDYHIVITDVKRLDMDGFKLLEIIGLEMDLPVIMVSAEDSKSSIMKGIRHGARDYLVKPVRIQEIKNIWQHVVRKRLVVPCDHESSITKELIMEQESMPSKKHEAQVELQEVVKKSNKDPSIEKKSRMTWSPALHLKFVDCIQLLEAKGRKVHPKRIREMMNVEGLSREQIASHLQKYRNMLKKHKDKMTQQSNLGIDLNRNGEILASKNYNLCNIAINPTPKFRSPSSSFTHMKQTIFRPSNQNAFQKNELSTNLVMQKRKLNFGASNSPSTALSLQSPLPAPEFKGLNCSAYSSRWKFPDEYMGSPFFGLDPGQSNMSPFPQSHAVSFRPAFPILGHASAEISPASRLSNLNSSPGQHEGGISKNHFGSENSNFGEQACHYANNRGQNPLLIDFMTNEEAKLFQDEEIREMIKQFSSDGAPRL